MTNQTELMSEFVRPVVRQDAARTDDGSLGFFGDLGGIDDALEADVDAPPPEWRPSNNQATATAADLESLALEPAEQADEGQIPVAALFGGGAGLSAPSAPHEQVLPSAPEHAQPNQWPGGWTGQHQQPGIPGQPVTAWPAVGNVPSSAQQSPIAGARPPPQQPPGMPLHHQGPHQAPPMHVAAPPGLGSNPAARPMYSSPPPSLQQTRPPMYSQPPPSMQLRYAQPPVAGPQGAHAVTPGYANPPPSWPQPHSSQAPHAMHHAQATASRMVPQHPAHAWPGAMQSQPQPPQHMQPASAHPPVPPGLASHTPTDQVPPAGPAPASPWRGPTGPAPAQMGLTGPRPIMPGNELRIYDPPPPPSAAQSAPGTPLSSISSMHPNAHFPVMPSPAQLMPAPPSTPGAESSSGNHGLQGLRPPPPGPPPARRSSNPGGAGPRGPGHAGRGLMPVLPGLETWVRHYRCMSATEVDEFLMFNMRNLHSGELYVDDYYYHAHQNKYYNAANAAVFRPRELYALAPNEKTVVDTVAHARVEGLGKLVYSSLRAPRQLLAVSKPAATTEPVGQENAPVLQGRAPARSDTATGEAENGVPTGAAEDDEEDEVVLVKPSKAAEAAARAAAEARASGVGGVSLHSAPEVAARKVIEDCNCQLLDVDDVDRVEAADAAAGAAQNGGAAAGGGGQQSAGSAGPRSNAAAGSSPAERSMYREQRRRLLMDGVADALSGGGGGRDGVFRYVATYPKGRRVIASVLQRMFAPVLPARGPQPPSPQPPRTAQAAPVMHLVLRNAKSLFGGNVRPAPVPGVEAPHDAHLVEATVAVAMNASVSLAQMQHPEDVLECLEALASSDIVVEGPHGEELGSRGALPLLLLFHTFRVDNGTPWLGKVLTTLFERAVALQLHVAGDFGPKAAAVGPHGLKERFDAAFSPIFDRFLVHLRSLQALMDRVAGEVGAEGALESLKGLAAGDVLQAMLGLCDSEQEASLALLLQQIVAC